MVIEDQFDLLKITEIQKGNWGYDPCPRTVQALAEANETGGNQVFFNI